MTRSRFCKDGKNDWVPRPMGCGVLSSGPGPFFGGATPHFGEFFLFTVVDALQQVDPKTASQVGTAC